MIEFDENGRVVAFTIKRSRWYRGIHNPDDPLSALMVNDGRMCCLGYYGEACGLEPEQMLEKPYPYSIKSELPEQMMWLIRIGVIGDNSDIASSLARTNDSAGLNEEQRESRIAEYFAKQGITVEFED